MPKCRFGRRHRKEKICLRRLDRTRPGNCGDGHFTPTLAYESCDGKFYCDECPGEWDPDPDPARPAAPRCPRCGANAGPGECCPRCGSSLNKPAPAKKEG